MGDAAHRMAPADDSARYRRLHETYYQQVLAFCVRRADRQEAKDLAAEVFAVVWRRIHSVPEGDAELSWLYGVAYRVVSHHWRSEDRRRRLTAKLASVPTEPPAGPETVVVQDREYELVLKAAARLRPKDREVLRLALWEELTYEQIAELMGLTVPTVRQRFHRAKRALTREFTRLGGMVPPAVAQEGGER